MNYNTIFSPDRRYRYTLWRDVPHTGWFNQPRPGGIVQFIGINPSIADAKINDRTVSRCIDFASRWGYDRLCMTNLFAFISTDKKQMLRQFEPVGPENDSFLLHIAAHAKLIVAAWGVDGDHHGRASVVRGFLNSQRKQLHCLRITKGGHPEHPLYLPRTLVPIPFP